MADRPKLNLSDRDRSKRNNSRTISHVRLEAGWANKRTGEQTDRQTDRHSRSHYLTRWGGVVPGWPGDARRRQTTQICCCWWHLANAIELYVGRLESLWSCIHHLVYTALKTSIFLIFFNNSCQKLTDFNNFICRILQIIGLSTTIIQVE